jgi:hypothetical protein
MFCDHWDTRTGKNEENYNQNKISVGLWELVPFAQKVMLVLQRAFIDLLSVVDMWFYQHYINKYVSTCI